MEESQSAIPARMTRSRRGSVESPVVSSPRKNTRTSRKLKDIAEKEPVDIDNDENHDKVDDNDDAASSVSSNSIKSCKVVLNRENFDGVETNGRKSVSHGTRSRRNSQLTEENLAAHSSPVVAGRRNLRSNSVTSVDSEVTQTSRRSSRLVNSQNTPKKAESVTQPTTPARRSSRLLSGNEKATDSPAKSSTPGRRLRSNSVASEDHSPPRRISSRLTESQGATPKSLKTKVSKLKEPITPRRASILTNKSILVDDIISEEPSDEEMLDVSIANKSKLPLKTHAEKEEDKIEENVVDNGGIRAEDEYKNVTIKEEPEELDVDTSNSTNEETVKSQKSQKSPKSPKSPVILIATSTVSSPTSSIHSPTRKERALSTESAEAMETSKIIDQFPESTPKDTMNNTPSKSLETTTMEKATTPVQKGTPKTQVLTKSNSKKSPANTDSPKVSGMVKHWEEMLSPKPAKSSPQNKSLIKSIDLTADSSENDSEINKSVGSNRSQPQIIQDIEHLDASSDAQSIENIPKSPIKTVEKVKKSVSTPNSSSQALNKDSPLDVSIVKSVSSPQGQKESIKRRQSMNQSTGLDQLEVSVLVEESKIEAITSTTPKQKGQSSKKSTPAKADTPKSSTKTPQKSPQVQKGETTIDKPQLLLRPPRESTFGSLSDTLTQEIDKIVADLDDHAVDNTSIIDKLVESTTPLSETVINDDFNAIASTTTSDTSKNTDKSEAIEQTPETAIELEQKEVEKIKDNSIEESHDMSIDVNNDMSIVVNETQFESDMDVSIKPTVEKAKEPVETESSIEQPIGDKVVEAVPVSALKSERKSVLILTPKNDKNQMSQKRIDTPFPDESTILEVTQNLENSEEQLKRKRREEREKARDSLKKLQESWNMSIKRRSVDANDASIPIDTLGAAEVDSKTDEKPVEKVTARNTWKPVQSICDTENEEEIAETEEGSDESGEEEEIFERSEYVLYQAEEAEDYESGDSMDEDERREIEDNQIEEDGISIGSEDTADDENDDYEEDGFVVNESEEEENEDEDGEIDEKESESESVEILPPKRRSRILSVSSSSDEDETENTNEASNDVEIVAMEQVEQVVVVSGSAPVEEEIVEGKTFATTYLVRDETESTEKMKKKSSKIDWPHYSEKELEIEEFDAEKEQKKEVSDVNTDLPSQTDEENRVEGSSVSSDTVSEANTKLRIYSVAKNSVSNAEEIREKQNTSLLVKRVAKEVVLNKRNSLPGIEKLSNSSFNQKTKRRTLGDLNPSAQTDSETKMQASTKETTEKENVNLNASVKTSPNDITLNTSATEENNNQKASKKVKIVVNAEESKEAAHSSHNESSSKTVTQKSKRKFVEVDANESMVEQPKSRKLKVVSSASGAFLEEPMTPEKKNKFGFTEAPKTPINPNFKIQKRIQLAYPGASRKRKSIYLNEDDDEIQALLPRPRWQINMQFKNEQPSKRARKIDLGSTEVILQPVDTKKKSKRTALVPIELAQYRQNKLHRPEIPRQNARSLLRERRKRAAHK